jgi:hypothetical protein
MAIMSWGLKSARRRSADFLHSLWTWTLHHQGQYVGRKADCPFGCFPCSFRFEMRTTLVEAMFCATLGQTHIIVSDVDLLDVTHGGFCLRIDMGRG